MKIVISSILPASDRDEIVRRERERERERARARTRVREVTGEFVYLHLHVTTNNEDLRLVV